MKKLLNFFTCVIAMILVSCIIRGIGEFYIQKLRDTKEVVLASQVFSVRYVLPTIFALLTGYVVTLLQKKED